MRRYSIVLASALALVAGSASVQAETKAKPDRCFRTSDIDNSVQASHTELNLKLRDHRYFQVQTKGMCFITPGIDPYVLQVRGGIDTVCNPIDMDLSAGSPGFVTPCFIDKIVPLTKEQVAALPKRQQP